MLTTTHLNTVTVDNSAVNTAAYGEYTVTYNVTDSSSNATVEVTRAVRVWPTLTLTTSGLGLGTPWRRCRRAGRARSRRVGVRGEIEIGLGTR